MFQGTLILDGTIRVVVAEGSCDFGYLDLEEVRKCTLTRDPQYIP